MPLTILTPARADHTHKHPIHIICASCGSDDVWRDAYASWDKKTQQWVLADVYDHGFCSQCDGESSLIERWAETGGPVDPHHLRYDEDLTAAMLDEMAVNLMALRPDLTPMSLDEWLAEHDDQLGADMKRAATAIIQAKPIA